MQNQDYLITFDAHAATVSFTGVVTPNAAMALRKTCMLLCNYYHHHHIMLEIESPGGQMHALAHIEDTLSQLRQRGIRLATRASFEAASAAAMLLALGDIGSRAVTRHASVLFHHARLDGSACPITASHAEEIAKALHNADARFTQAILRHLVVGFGGEAAMFATGSARCHLLQDEHMTIAQQMELTNSSPGKWLGRLQKVWEKCAQRASPAPYLNYLAQRCAKDMPLDLREAYALLLLDAIDLVPALQAALQPARSLATARATAANQHPGKRRLSPDHSMPVPGQPSAPPPALAA